MAEGDCLYVCLRDWSISVPVISLVLALARFLSNWLEIFCILIWGVPGLNLGFRRVSEDFSCAFASMFSAQYLFIALFTSFFHAVLFHEFLSNVDHPAG